MVWIRRYKQKKLISKISVDSNFTVSSYAWLCVFHCSHRLLCGIKSCVRDFSVKIALISALKWVQPNSFGEVCFLEESYKNKQKNHILKILTSVSMPLIQFPVILVKSSVMNAQVTIFIFFILSPKVDQFDKSITVFVPIPAHAPVPAKSVIFSLKYVVLLTAH